LRKIGGVCIGCVAANDYERCCSSRAGCSSGDVRSTGETRKQRVRKKVRRKVLEGAPRVTNIALLLRAQTKLAQKSRGATTCRVCSSQDLSSTVKRRERRRRKSVQRNVFKGAQSRLLLGVHIKQGISSSSSRRIDSTFKTGNVSRGGAVIAAMSRNANARRQSSAQRGPVRFRCMKYSTMPVSGKLDPPRRCSAFGTGNFSRGGAVIAAANCIAGLRRRSSGAWASSSVIALQSSVLNHGRCAGAEDDHESPHGDGGLGFMNCWRSDQKMLRRRPPCRLYCAALRPCQPRQTHRGRPQKQKNRKTEKPNY
jgi:hypothetical protein